MQEGYKKTALEIVTAQTLHEFKVKIDIMIWKKGPECTLFLYTKTSSEKSNEGNTIIKNSLPARYLRS